MRSPPVNFGAGGHSAGAYRQAAPRTPRSASLHCPRRARLRSYAGFGDVGRFLGMQPHLWDLLGHFNSPGLSRHVQAASNRSLMCVHAWPVRCPGTSIVEPLQFSRACCLPSGKLYACSSRAAPAFVMPLLRNVLRHRRLRLSQRSSLVLSISSLGTPRSLLSWLLRGATPYTRAIISTLTPHLPPGSRLIFYTTYRHYHFRAPLS